MAEGETKYCEECGGPYHRDAKICASAWEARRFCSPSCSATAQHRAAREQKALLCAAMTKPCAICGGPVHMRVEESPSDFAHRKCCSGRCGRALAEITKRTPKPPEEVRVTTNPLIGHCFKDHSKAAPAGTLGWYVPPNPDWGPGRRVL